MRYFLFLVIPFFLISCDSNFRGFKKINDYYGYKIVNNIDTGTAVQNGVFMLADARFLNDSNVTIAGFPASGFSMQIPLQNPVGNYDLMHVFKQLTEGDSAIIKMHADSFFTYTQFNGNRPENVRRNSFITIELKINALFDELQYDDYLIQKEFEEKVMAQKMFQAYLDAVGATDGPHGSGFYRMIQQQGKGKNPEFGQNITIHYTCMTMDGRQLENTYLSNQPVTFQLGSAEIMRGVTEATMRMQKGEKSRFILPYYLAYGEQGGAGIPPLTHMIVDIELLDFK